MTAFRFSQFACALVLLLLAACAPQSNPQVFRATVAPTQNSAPVYTATPTLTPSMTFTPSDTPTATPTVTLTPSVTPTPAPTQPLFTLTPPSAEGAPAPVPQFGAEFSPAEGWSCDDFPCQDDLDGFMERIQVPPGYRLSHVGQFPGQPMQITYGPDGRLYATLLEGGTRSGAVYAMNVDGTSERYSGDFVSPVGLAFQPGTNVLYVSARVTLEEGGGLWRVLPDGSSELVLDDLPCCFQIVDNQPNGMTFGPDGYLYLGVGSLTDQAEPPPGPQSQYAEVTEYEAAILRVHPHTGAVEVYARGIRNPYDLTFTSDGQLYATDNGLLRGQGDRLLAVDEGAHYGWPYYRNRDCENCPFPPPRLEVAPDLLGFRNQVLPRGLVAYTATQFPANTFDNLFVALWNGVRGGQQIVRIDPSRVPSSPEALEQYVPEPFVTGLIRPVDVALAPDGSLVVADFIYGHVWRVTYEG